MLAIRIVLVVAAVAGAAWLVVAERGARAGADLEARAFASGRPDPALGARERARAERWSADTQPAQVYALLLERAGDAAGAVRVLRGAAAREPRNPDAWRLLAFVARRVDPPLAARARGRVRELVPPLGGPQARRRPLPHPAGCADFSPFGARIVANCAGEGAGLEVASGAWTSATASLRESGGSESLQESL